MSKIPEVPKAERTCENCNRGQDADEAYCLEDSCDGLDWTERLSDFRARAEAIIADLKKRVAASDREVEQTLGKALGYAPTFPEASRVDDGQVNVGEHVPTTIAIAAAKKIAGLMEELDEAEKNCVLGLSHEVLTGYGAPNGHGLTILGRIEALADKSDRNGERREKAERERDDLQKIADVHVTVFDEMGTALGMSYDALPDGHFYAGGVLDETKRVRQQLAEVTEDRDAALARSTEDVDHMAASLLSEVTRVAAVCAERGEYAEPLSQQWCPLCEGSYSVGMVNHKAYCPIGQMKRAVVDARAEREELAKERDKCNTYGSELTDDLDLARDEFRRIQSCPGVNDEIAGLARRGQKKIEQRVPVLMQRDIAEHERDALRGQLAAMREAIEDRGCDHGVIVKDACVKCHDKCPMGLACTSDIGKPEANVIQAAQAAAIAFTEGADPSISDARMYEVCRAALRELAEAVTNLPGETR